MTIPRLNGLWDEVGDSFMKFSQQLPNIINPNAKYLQGVRELIAKDPSMIQKYIDMESESPGILNKLGLGGLANQLSGSSPSSGLLVERETRKALSAEPNTDEGVQLRAKTLGVKDKVTREREAKESAVDIAYKESATELNRLQSEIAKLTKHGKVAEANLLQQTWLQRDSAQKLVSELKLNGLTPFKAYQAGQLTPEQIQAYHTLPEYEKAWESEFKVWKQKQDAELDKQRLSLGYYQTNQNGPEAEANKQRARLAGQIALFSAVPFDYVNAYMQAPMEQKIRIEHITNPEELDDAGKALYRGYLAAQKYNTKIGMEEVRYQLKSSDPRIKELLKTITTSTDKNIKISAISALNNEYKQAFSPLVDAGLKKDIPQVGYDPSRWTGSPKDLFWTSSDPEVESQATAFGFKIKGPAQTKMDNAASDSFDYDKATSLILSNTGSDPKKQDAAIKEILSKAASNGVKVDSIRLRTMLLRGAKK